MHPDIMGLCGIIDETNVRKKDNSGMMQKRIINIMDLNGDTIQIQAFENNATTVAGLQTGIIVGFQNLSLNEYNQTKYLIFNGNSSLDLNPPHNSQFEGIKNNLAQEINSEIPVMSFVDALEKFENTSNAFKFMVPIQVMDIDVNQSYRACPMENCERKIINEGNVFKCEKCNKTYTMFAIHALLKVCLHCFNAHIRYNSIVCFLIFGRFSEKMRKLNNGLLHSTKHHFRFSI